jgi:glycosyltransferase involved in cell wall biosynthesis
MKKKRLLLFPPEYSSLIRKEAEMFASEYEVKVFDFHSRQKILIPFRFLLQFLFLVKNISRAEIMVSRFVGYQTILPILFSKLTGKPVVCIMGGLECIKFPSVKTGSYVRPFFGTITKWCLKNATHLCPVHDTLVLTDYTYQDDDYPKQGYKFFVPDCETPYTVIRNGYDAEKWKPAKEKIPNTFITVAHGIEMDHLYRLKGIDLIMAVADSFPQCSFTIVGGNKEMLQMKIPNVRFTGEIANEKLHELLGTHEYYLQLSITEGFPNALCEAMLCECIPIGSNVGAIPEIIANEELLLKKRDLEQLKILLSKALSCNKSVESKNARARIANNYQLKQRQDKFFELFSKLVRKN